IAVFVESQLTFSSGWGNGKRSISSEQVNDDCGRRKDPGMSTRRENVVPARIHRYSSEHELM
ncbi:hypothetical protein SFRURICE_005171, partial [Spodoptera frugiperda]